MSIGGAPSTNVVVFNFAAFVRAYPQFGGVLQQQAQEFFNRITLGGLLDNSPTSPIVDTYNNGSGLFPLAQRTMLLNAAVAHFCYLYTPDKNGNVRPVGRIGNAAEGTVNVGLEYVTPATATEAFWNQSPFGAYVWVATLPYRSAFYVPGARIRPYAGLGYFRRGL